MATVESDLQRCKPDLLNEHIHHPVYECRIWLSREDGGGVSVVAPYLPGVVSQGESETEAIARFREAFQCAAEEYQNSGIPIPWADAAIFDKPQDTVEKRILVHV